MWVGWAEWSLFRTYLFILIMLYVLWFHLSQNFLNTDVLSIEIFVQMSYRIIIHCYLRDTCWPREVLHWIVSICSHSHYTNTDNGTIWWSDSTYIWVLQQCCRLFLEFWSWFVCDHHSSFPSPNAPYSFCVDSIPCTTPSSFVVFWLSMDHIITECITPYHS